MAWKSHQLRLFGHRGASAREPENTMEAFARALADGANALELDVHLTRDRRTVVAHDPDGLRTAGRADPIRDCTVEEIAGWDVAARSDLGRGRSMHAPRLEEVIATFSEVPISLDIKPDDAGCAGVVLDTIRRHQAEPRITVGSFHGHVIRRLRRLGYEGPTALTRGEVAMARFLPWFLCRPMVKGDAAMIPRRHGSIRLDHDGYIGRCRRLGLRVDVWVVNELDVARSLVSAGATGIVTDDPGRLAVLLSEAG